MIQQNIAPGSGPTTVSEETRLQITRTAVFLAHSSFDSPFRVGSHQLAKALNDRGWKVVHISTPLTFYHFLLARMNDEYRRRVKNFFSPMRKVFESTYELIPLALVPWQIAKYVPGFATELYAGPLGGLKRRAMNGGFAKPDLLFVDEPRLAGLANAFSPKCKIYRSTDLYHEMKADRSIIKAERKLLHSANGVVGTSMPVLDHLRKLSPSKPALLLANGVEFEVFSEPTPEPRDLNLIPRPRIIYAGALDERFDFEGVIALARQRPNYSIILIGPISEGPRFEGVPMNVKVLGSRLYRELPAYLQHADVGIIPMTKHPANQGRSPMKIYEYGAAGLPVVASKTTELSRRGLGFALLYDEPSDLPNAIDAALRAQKEMSRCAIEESRTMSWSGRAEVLLDFTKRIQTA